MGKSREVDPEADARAWREADLPELTPERVKALRDVGFFADRLRHLAATGRYGRSLAVSVLVCFTDACPRGATIQDVARAGEASRMITSRSGDEFQAAIIAHGLDGLQPRRKPESRGGVRQVQAEQPPPPRLPGQLPTSPARWWLGWFLVLLLALLSTTGLAALDFGFGAVFGVVCLGVGWALVVRRMVYGRCPVPKRVRLMYLGAAVAFVVASAGAADAVMVCFAHQGVGRVDSASLQTGTHGTQYTQCTVQQPDGSYADLRFGGACPGPEGTPVPMFYVAGGDDQGPWRPVLGTAGSLAPMIALWGVGTLTGCGLLVRVALTP